jgi:hypothetical protein
MLSVLLAVSPARADFATTAYDKVPALKWFELPAQDRTSIVSAIASASNTNFLDVFSCITLFARDTAYRDDPLNNLIWLCSAPMRK